MRTQRLDQQVIVVLGLLVLLAASVAPGAVEPATERNVRPGE